MCTCRRPSSQQIVQAINLLANIYIHTYYYHHCHYHRKMIQTDPSWTLHHEKKKAQIKGDARKKKKKYILKHKIKTNNQRRKLRTKNIFVRDPLSLCLWASGKIILPSLILSSCVVYTPNSSGIFPVHSFSRSLSHAYILSSHSDITHVQCLVLALTRPLWPPSPNSFFFFFLFHHREV